MSPKVFFFVSLFLDCLYAVSITVWPIRLFIKIIFSRGLIYLLFGYSAGEIELKTLNFSKRSKNLSFSSIFVFLNRRSVVSLNNQYH